MIPPIFRVCSAEPAVTDILGANPVRLFPFGIAPAGVVYPYAVWQIITGSPENYLSGSPDMDSVTVQVDVYAKNATSADAATKALRDAVEPHAHIVRWGGQSKDPETGSFRVSFDVEWHVER